MEHLLTLLSLLHSRAMSKFNDVQNNVNKHYMDVKQKNKKFDIIEVWWIHFKGINPSHFNPFGYN